MNKIANGSIGTELTGGEKISRRVFVVSSLAAGFALAVLPVSAETITTDSKGLIAGEVKIPVNGGQIPAYRAMPDKSGPFATILVVHEIFGVHEHIKDLCRRLAKRGYFAVAPALFAREGDVAAMSDMSQIMKVVKTVPDSQVASDLDATVAWAAGTGKANTQKLGIVGFCWGGRQVWLYAVHNPTLRAGVAWYGLLRIPKTDLTPESPLDLANRVKVPVLGLYGGADAAIPISQIDEMRAALKAAGEPSEIVVYPDTPHGFNADYRASYRPTQARDGWKRMLAWFDEHGVA
ncbi:MAG TPA: dienelactone hydrolase family protein [Candidatus Binataceae bacterium]|nr:dienelactone hydrolase family protein [Candidatus Binataceae bacterium]